MDPQIESLNTVVSDAALQYQFGSKLDLQNSPRFGQPMQKIDLPVQVTTLDGI